MEESLSPFVLLLLSSQIFTELFFTLYLNFLPAWYDSYSFIFVAKFCFFTHWCIFILSLMYRFRFSFNWSMFFLWSVFTYDLIKLHLTGLEKYLNSTLPVGQVTFKFCLPRALPCFPKFSNSLIIHDLRMDFNVIKPSWM